ncbi:tyrosine-type recombinase/integrase [Neptuniibacter sp. QD37_11]|uniref:tyrosine-type recombinase/integrase n=1 Tax=Neptuniibacter sp. QD37_11 TaxID=3398209 RepID=UPI0039F467AC
MDTIIKTIKCHDGERAHVLVATSSGIPLYYPNLFITSQVRSASKATGTAKAALQHLKVLCLWETEFNIDLTSRIKQKQFLAAYELDSLRDFCQKSLANKRPPKVIRFDRKPEAVGKNTQYDRLTVIAAYLEFLAKTLHGHAIDRELKQDIAELKAGVISRRPRQESKHLLEDLDRALTDETYSGLVEVMQLSHPSNPFAPEIQLRNWIIIEILTALGLRKGELANIRLDDVDLQALTLKVIRRPDDNNDPRKDQPVVKTAERTLPISENLADAIEYYQREYRSQFRPAKKHGYLLVAHKGPSQGSPLTIKSIDYLFQQLKIALNDPDISPHSLRHQWNYDYSISVDSMEEPMSEAEEIATRSYLMGWSPTSGMAARYNRRHIKEEAHEAVRTHQDKLKNMRNKERNND